MHAPPNPKAVEVDHTSTTPGIDTQTSTNYISLTFPKIKIKDDAESDGEREKSTADLVYLSFQMGGEGTVRCESTSAKAS